MEHVVVKDAILASFVWQVYRLVGALFFDAPAIVVRIDASEVRIVDAYDGLTEIGKWYIHNVSDIPDVIRLWAQKDPFITRCVILDTGEEFVLVDERTLKPYPLFGFERAVRYAP